MWTLWTRSAIAVLVGSLVGSNLVATKPESRTIKKLFGLVFIGIGIILFVQAIGN